MWRTALSHWRRPPKLEQLCKEPLPVVSQSRICWKQSPSLRQKVSFWQKHRWNARNAACDRNTRKRSDVSFRLGYWAPKLHPFLRFPTYNIFAWTCALEMACKGRVMLQSHRWHLAVGAERSRSLGMQKVFETMSSNLNCLLQAFRLHRWHCNKAGWFGMAKKLPQRAEKSLASVCFLFAASWQTHWESCANKGLREVGCNSSK